MSAREQQLGDSTGRQIAEENKSRSEQRYLAMLDALDRGYSVIEVLFDDAGKAIDYRFLEVNRAFEEQTGLIGVQGKRMRELAPEHEEHWFEIYGRVAKTGEPIRFQRPAEQLHRFYDNYAYRVGEPEEHQVAVIFNDITERKLAEEAVAHSSEITHRLLMAARALAEPFELNDVLDAVAEVVLAATAHTRASVFLWDDKARAGVLAASAGPMPFPAGTTLPFDQLSPITKKAIAEKRTHVIDYDSLPADQRPLAVRYGSHMSLLVPLVRGGRLLGAVGVDDPNERREFTAEEIELVEGIAPQAAVAIENGRLYQATRQEVARTTVMSDVAAAASTLDVQEVATRALEVLQRLLGARSGVIYSADREAGVLRMLALNGYPEEVSPLFEEVAIDEHSVSGQVVLRDALLTFTSDELPEGTRARAIAVNEFGNGWVGVPFHSHGAVVGDMTLVFDAERRLEDEDYELFTSIGDQLGVALENARLFGVVDERARVGQSMAEIHEDLASSLDIEQTLPLVLRKICRAVKGAAATVADRVEGGWRVRHLAGFEQKGVRAGDFFPDQQTPSLVRVLRTREPFVVGDVATTPAANQVLAEQIGYRALAAFPLVVRGEVSGALTVYFAGPRTLSEVEFDYLRRLAFAVSLADENSRLYRTEHRIAETLQTALLALPERIRGIEFAHAYYSATEEARVGGDFYDLFEIEHGKIGLTMGDMSGHGVDAAVLTSLMKNTIRVQATQQDKKPDEVVAGANKILYKESPVEVFATVFFGVLRLSDGLLEYCSAGHPTGACICHQGGVRPLPSNSPIVGAFEHEQFGLSIERLGVHDLLFLYTDGLTEARRDSELFGEERLFDLLALERGGNPGETVRRVLDEVLAFTEGGLSDDLAVLAVQLPEEA